MVVLLDKIIQNFMFLKIIKIIYLNMLFYDV